MAQIIANSLIDLAAQIVNIFGIYVILLIGFILFVLTSVHNATKSQ